MTKRVQTRQQREIYNLLLLFLTGYGAGLLPFMTDGDFIDADTAADLALKAMTKQPPEAVKVKGGEHIPQAQTRAELADRVIYSVMRRFGGLEHWRNVFREYKQADFESWTLLYDLSLIGGFDFPNVEAVAEKHARSARNIYDRKQKALDIISREIILRNGATIHEFTAKKREDGGSIGGGKNSESLHETAGGDIQTRFPEIRPKKVLENESKNVRKQ